MILVSRFFFICLLKAKNSFRPPLSIGNSLWPKHKNQLFALYGFVSTSSGTQKEIQFGGKILSSPLEPVFGGDP